MWNWSLCLCTSVGAAHLQLPLVYHGLSHRSDLRGMLTLLKLCTVDCLPSSDFRVFLNTSMPFHEDMIEWEVGMSPYPEGDLSFHQCLVWVESAHDFLPARILGKPTFITYGSKADKLCDFPELGLWLCF